MENGPFLRRYGSVQTLWVDGYHTSVVLRFSFFELFAPFCGYSSLRFIFAALREIFVFALRGGAGDRKLST